MDSIELFLPGNIRCQYFLRFLPSCRRRSFITPCYFLLKILARATSRTYQEGCFLDLLQIGLDVFGVIVRLK
jgi:hypothetical protein